jgi:hypothetical protein
LRGERGETMNLPVSRESFVLGGLRCELVVEGKAWQLDIGWIESAWGYLELQIWKVDIGGSLLTKAV